MIGKLAKLTIRVALTPAELAARVALDVLFGKEEPFEYPLTGTSPPLARSGPSLAEATEAYQALLEGVRAHPEDEELAEHLDKARAAMEVAWLEHLV